MSKDSLKTSYPSLREHFRPLQIFRSIFANIYHTIICFSRTLRKERLDFANKVDFRAVSAGTSKYFCAVFANIYHRKVKFSQTLGSKKTRFFQTFEFKNL